MKSSPPKQFLSLFLNKCSEHVMSNKERKELKRKRKELQIMQNVMRDSMILLRVAQSDVQDRDVEDNMRITGFQTSKDRKNHVKLPLNIQLTTTNQFISHSLRKRNASSLEKIDTPTEKKHHTILTPKSTKRAHKLSFPTLLMKAKRHKQPSNASRNKFLPYKDQSPPKKEQEETITYEQIKTQRQKVQQIRHMTVLGKVIEQNYKKQVKKIETRRKLFNTKREKSKSYIF